MPESDTLTSFFIKTAKNLFTVGYEGLTLEAFIQRLQSSSIQTLVDVRELPLSRKRGFSKRALAESLASHGIMHITAKTTIPEPERRAVA